MARPATLDSKTETNTFSRTKSIFSEDQNPKNKRRKSFKERFALVSQLQASVGMKKEFVTFGSQEIIRDLQKQSLFGLWWGKKKTMLNGLKVEAG